MRKYERILKFHVMWAALIASTGFGDDSLTALVERVGQSCETYELWSPSPQDSRAFNQSFFMHCLAELDALNARLSEQEAAELSVSQKLAALSRLESLHQFLRDYSAGVREKQIRSSGLFQAQPALSQALAADRAVRLAASRIRNLETWQGLVQLSSGVFSAGTEPRFSMGGRASLHVDLGRNIEGHTELSTGTPRKEESGLVKVPVETTDTVHLSQIWLRTTRLRRISFQAGVFPEPEDFFFPERWPFLSLKSVVNLYQGPFWNLDFILRHDVYGVWDLDSNVYKPAKVERNLSALVLRYSPFVGLLSKLAIVLRGQMHWYADPEGVLGRLSLGRKGDIRGPLLRPPGYRILKVDQEFAWAFTNDLTLRQGITTFLNIVSSTESKGTHARLSLEWNPQSWMVAPGASWADLGCLSSPAIQVPTHHFPGQKQWGLQTELTRRLAGDLKVTLSGSWMRVRQGGASESCPGPGDSFPDSPGQETEAVSAMLTVVKDFLPGK